MQLTFVLFFLILIYSILITLSFLHAQGDECVYTLYVKTASIIKSGTDSKISLSLGDPQGRFVWVKDLQPWGLMGPSYDYYERCNLDIFSGTGPCTLAHPFVGSTWRPMALVRTMVGTVITLRSLSLDHTRGAARPSSTLISGWLPMLSLMGVVCGMNLPTRSRGLSLGIKEERQPLEKGTVDLWSICWCFSYNLKLVLGFSWVTRQREFSISMNYFLFYLPIWSSSARLKLKFNYNSLDIR